MGVEGRRRARCGLVPGRCLLGDAVGEAAAALPEVAGAAKRRAPLARARSAASAAASHDQARCCGAPALRAACSSPDERAACGVARRNARHPCSREAAASGPTHVVERAAARRAPTRAPPPPRRRGLSQRHDGRRIAPAAYARERRRIRLPGWRPECRVAAGRSDAPSIDRGKTWSGRQWRARRSAPPAPKCRRRRRRRASREQRPALAAPSRLHAYELGRLRDDRREAGAHTQPPSPVRTRRPRLLRPADPSEPGSVICVNDARQLSACGADEARLGRRNHWESPCFPRRRNAARGCPRGNYGDPDAYAGSLHRRVGHHRTAAAADIAASRRLRRPTIAGLKPLSCSRWFDAGAARTSKCCTLGARSSSALERMCQWEVGANDAARSAAAAGAAAAQALDSASGDQHAARGCAFGAATTRAADGAASYGLIAAAASWACPAPSGPHRRRRGRRRGLSSRLRALSHAFYRNRRRETSRLSVRGRPPLRLERDAEVDSAASGDRSILSARWSGSSPRGPAATSRRRSPCRRQAGGGAHDGFGGRGGVLGRSGYRFAQLGALLDPSAGARAADAILQ